MEQIERIEHMEQILDGASAAVTELKAALEKYRELQDGLQELGEYYCGELWRQDLEDDSAAKLPRELKRGVLSEDAVYDLLKENAALRQSMKNMPG